MCIIDNGASRCRTRKERFRARRADHSTTTNSGRLKIKITINNKGSNDKNCRSYFLFVCFGMVTKRQASTINQQEF